MAVLDTILLVGLILQNPSTGDAGRATPSTSPGPRDPSLDRIRERLAEPPVITEPPATPLFTTRSSERPLFTVEVQGLAMPPWDWPDTGTGIPGYVRPRFPPTHYEFLMMVTPEEFRGPVLYPCCIPVLSLARVITKATRAAQRRGKEANARREVEEALAALEASRASAEKR